MTETTGLSVIFNYTSWGISVKSAGVVCPMNSIKVIIFFAVLLRKYLCKAVHLSLKLSLEATLETIFFNIFTIAIILFAFTDL